MKWMQPLPFVPSWILSRRVSSFQRFFELGQEESASPFLDAQAKRISRHIALKSAGAAALLLVSSWLLRRCVAEPLWPIPLAFVFLLSGTPSLIAAVEDIVFRRNVNIDVLTTVAGFGALAIGRPMEGALLLVLFTLSDALEGMVTLKAKTTLCAIHEIAPLKACCVGDGGHLEEKFVGDVRVGERIVVRLGEIVPLDGVVRKGQALISMAHMTGESRPLSIGVKGEVVSGARVLDGSIEVEVRLVRHDSTVSKLIELITRAHSSKPQLSQTFDRYGHVYALLVIGITAFLLLFFPLVLRMPVHGEAGGVTRAISFLITASPCALILAVPITYLSALGAASRRGSILKGSMIIDRMVACDVVAFDKTGTLTEGDFVVDSLVPISTKAFDRERALLLAASLERHAIHPVARAIVAAFSAKKEPFLEVSRVRVMPGEGVDGVVVDGGRETELFIGEAEGAMRRYQGGAAEEAKRVIAKEQAEGHVLAALVIDRADIILFVLSDRIRPQSYGVVQALKARGAQVVMLTGDHAESAQRIGSSLGIDDVYYGLTPERKVALVSELSSKRGVVMVGDGINDAPALHRATVGMSMGQLSSASAREASDIVLLHNDLSAIPWLFDKAFHVRRVVAQNLIIAFAAVLVGTASSIQGLIPLWAAVAIHEGSTLLVGLNALRLLSLKV